MPTGTDYPVAVVIVNQHEPEGEAAGRLIELAEEKGYDARVVEAVRGENDAALSFRVPEDVAEAFNADRSDRWSADKIENDDKKVSDLDAAGVNGDAYAADQARTAQQARATNAAVAEEQNTTPARAARSGQAKEK